MPGELRDIRSFVLRIEYICEHIAGNVAPRTAFRAMRRDHIFLFNAKRKIWEKESAPPDTMLFPALLLHSLKRVVGFA